MVITYKIHFNSQLPFIEEELINYNIIRKSEERFFVKCLKNSIRTYLYIQTFSHFEQLFAKTKRKCTYVLAKILIF